MARAQEQAERAVADQAVQPSGALPGGEERAADWRFIGGRLDKLAALEPGTVHIGCLGPVPPPNAHHVPATRCNFILSGRKRVTLPLAAGCVTVPLGTGDGHFSPAATWELQSWDSDHELLCIVHRESYLRVSHYRFARGVRTCRWHHTDRPCADEFRFTLKALEAQAARPGATLLPGLLSALVRFAVAECAVPPRTGDDPALRLAREAQRLIDDGFHERLDRALLARRLDISVGHLSHVFRAVHGVGVVEHLTRVRLEHAARLLRGTALPVHAVAGECGFGDVVHFVRTFRRHWGLPPGRFRLAAGSDVTPIVADPVADRMKPG